MSGRALLTLLAAALLAFNAAPPALARELPLDPLSIPYSPVRKVIPGCGGLEAGRSREWKVETETNADGEIEHSFSGGRRGSYPETDLRSIIYHPERYISFTCMTSEYSSRKAVEAWSTTYATEVREIFRKSPDRKNFSGIQPFRLPGVASSYAVFWDGAGEYEGVSFGMLFGGFGTARFTVFAQLHPIRPPAAETPVLLNPGSVVKRVTITGDTIKATLTAPAYQSKKGDLYPVAPDVARQRAWLTEYFKSIRGPGK